MSSPVVSRPAVAAPRSPNQGLGVLFGALFVALGVCGFLVFPLGTFFDTEGGELLWLGINPFHVFLWVVSGAALVIAGTAGVGSARTINAWVGAPMLVLGVLGLFVRGTELNVLAFTLPSALLWIAAGGLLLLTAIGADRPKKAVVRR